MASVTLILASKGDQEHGQKITEALGAFDVEPEVVIGSAHKVPRRVLKVLDDLNALEGPHVVITSAGRSNALSGMVAANCVHPVIACPPFKDKSDYLVNIHSTLQMPSETPALTVVDPKNAAAAAVRILAGSDGELRQKVEERMESVKKDY